MYRHCIHCSADVGTNQVLEWFPVGRTLAFDPARGRLWAVCGRCARWNLAPIEERWEAIEEAEKLYFDARVHAHSGNIGKARLADGTGLVRIGAAPRVEAAGARYARTLVRRRRAYLVATGLFWGGHLVHGPVGVGMFSVALLYTLATVRNLGPVLQRLPPGLAPEGRGPAIRKSEVGTMRLVPDGDGLAVRVAATKTAPPLVLRDDLALGVLARGMVLVNHKGAGHDDVRIATGLIDARGSAAEYLRTLCSEEGTLLREPDYGWRRELAWLWSTPEVDPAGHLSSDEGLALEIALHEERERRALEGELKLLESAWREAEELASIADRLAGQLAGIVHRAT
ncbi:MAG TPA: hypothetical protein VF541_14985 [Longimicrobium sp.]|jgi:hypothetical protein